MNALLLAGFACSVWLVIVRVTAPLFVALVERVTQRWPGSPMLLAALTLAPLGLATALAASLLSLPAALGGCHCLGHAHHVHLCFDHVEFSWPLAGACLVGALLFARAARNVLRVLAAAVETSRWAARSTARDGTVVVAESLGAGAATVGLLAPRVLVGAPLWSSLDGASRDAVLAHERAHVARRDPLTLLCLRLGACFMSAGAGDQLVARWRLAAELACDRAAAVAVGDPFSVATALVACARLQHKRQLAHAMGALGDAAELEVRVRRLLDAPSSARVERGVLRGDLLRASAFLVVMVVVVSALAGPSTHHAAETVLGWLG